MAEKPLFYKFTKTWLQFA